MLLPPRPPADAVPTGRAVLRVVVDTAGRVVKDSTIVCGVADATYARTLARAVASVRYAPGQRDGRPIQAPAIIAFSF